MNEFQIGQQVRFWSLDECIEYKNGINAKIEDLLARLDHWDEIVTVIEILSSSNIKIQHKDGASYTVSQDALSFDLRDNYHLAIEVLGEDYF
jgi:hypothetical protein